MFIVRAILSYIRAVSAIHTALCGRAQQGTECTFIGWDDIRIPGRAICIFACLRLVANGTSIMIQYNHPERTFLDRGNDQLFYRSLIQATGTPMNFLRGVLKIVLLSGTVYERHEIEIYADLTRALLLVPICSISLFH